MCGSFILVESMCATPLRSGVESRLKEVKDEIEFIEADIRDYDQVRQAC